MAHQVRGGAMFDDESPLPLLTGMPGYTARDPAHGRRRAARAAGGGMWQVWAGLVALGILYGAGLSLCKLP
ncbi:hypothetical protein [Nitrospira sp. Kam-Ns4a]